MIGALLQAGENLMGGRDIAWRRILTAGVLSGVVQVSAGVIMYLAGVYFSPWSGTLSLLVLTLCLVVGLQWYGHTSVSPVPYWLAVTVGLTMVVVTAVTYVTYNVISVSFVYPHFLEDMTQARFAALSRTQAGTTQARAQLFETLRAQATLRAVVSSNFRFLTTMGGVSAALLAMMFPRSQRRLRVFSGSPK
jgi:hypothetical protein